MRLRLFAILPLTVVILALVFPTQSTAAQGAALVDQLRSQYKLAKLGADSSGTSVIEAGTVLVVQKGGILGVPPANYAIAPATYRDGELHAPSASRLLVGNDTRNITVGEKVYVSKIDVNLKNEKVSMTVVECDSCNGQNQPSSYKGLVVFQFAKGFLETAQLSQVTDVIKHVLTIDNSSDNGQQAGQDQQQQQQPAQDQPPAQIQMGQTIDDVVAAFGQPEKIVTLGSKQIYVYKDLKVTFINGRVVDVQ
ncbi:MAG: hypothetical protein WBP79_11740 [Candidatus Acidiferrales bacterium]